MAYVSQKWARRSASNHMVSRAETKGIGHALTALKVMPALAFQRSDHQDLVHGKQREPDRACLASAIASREIGTIDEAARNAGISVSGRQKARGAEHIGERRE